MIHRGEDIKPGIHPDIHRGLRGTATANKFRVEIKERAANDRFRSAAIIAK